MHMLNKQAEMKNNWHLVTGLNVASERRCIIIMPYVCVCVTVCVCVCVCVCVSVCVRAWVWVCVCMCVCVCVCVCVYACVHVYTCAWIHDGRVCMSANLPKMATIWSWDEVFSIGAEVKGHHSAAVTFECAGKPGVGEGDKTGFLRLRNHQLRLLAMLLCWFRFWLTAVALLVFCVKKERWIKFLRKKEEEKS